MEVIDIEGGTRYTGIDAQNAFAQLKSSMSANSQKEGDKDGDKGRGVGETLREWANTASKWVDDKIGNKARAATDKTSKWASEYSESFESIGAGNIFQEHMGPAIELYEMGFGATGASITSTRGFAVEAVAEGYTVAAEKFEYFFGKVTSSASNQRRSLQNLKD